jgi:hypothetical protein
MKSQTVAPAWLLLIHQLPAKPAYLRVKIWRRLQALGAVALKGSVYALPHNEETQEDLQWLLKEIAEGGGEGFVCEAKMSGGLSDDDVRSQFSTARESDYTALIADARALSEKLGGDAGDFATAQAQLARLKKRLAQVVAIDFFQAEGRAAAERVLHDLDELLNAAPAWATPEPGIKSLSDLKGRTWVTRRGVHVDRIACAWLIRRFIDPEAIFKFVEGRGYRPNPGELRFDMFEAEFTHEGDRCSFEVFLQRLEIDDAALRAIAEIIHDLDIKDDKFGRPETVGIGRMLDAIAAGHAADEDRIARGSAMFDDLHALFRTLEAGAPR